MRILSIGNSFSVDCQRYVSDIAEADNVSVELGNLYIGGCSLEQHCTNIESAALCYEYFKNNVSMGSASIQTGLKDNDWDIITLQQASHFSGIPDTYYPYIETLASFVRQQCPNAKLYINETWAYEYNSTHSAFPNYQSDRQIMHERLFSAYSIAREKIASGFIPVGEAVRIARENVEFRPEDGGLPLTRDGFHLSYIPGRYLAAATWYETLTGNSILNNGFIPSAVAYAGTDRATCKPIYEPIPGTAATSEQLSLLKAACHKACTDFAVRCV